MPKKDSILFDIQKQQVSFDTDYIVDALQEVLFGSTTQKEFFVEKSYFNICNRWYIGSKYKLLPWIFSIINNECSGDSFTDIFAGTGVVSAGASNYFK